MDSKDNPLLVLGNHIVSFVTFFSLDMACFCSVFVFVSRSGIYEFLCLSATATSRFLSVFNVISTC